MATIKYGDYNLDHIQIDNFQTRNSIEDSNKFLRVKIILPALREYVVLIQRPFKDVTINFNNKDYVFQIFGNPVFKPDSINIELNSKLYNKIDTDLTDILVQNNQGKNYNVSEYNPITAVKDLLDIAGIDYDFYTFGIAESYMTTHNIKMDIAYIKEFMNISLLVFLNEILNRVGFKVIFDIGEEKLFLFNFLNDFENDNFRKDVFDDENIDPVTYSETESANYYNGFNIGIYPILSARSVYEYNYQVEFLSGTDYFHESLLEAVNFLSGTAVTLKYDRIVNDVFYATGSQGILTGLSELYSTDLSSETVEKREISKALYDGKDSIWSDVKTNNSSGILRQTNLSGAFRIGNQIIKRMYKKRRQFKFNYFIDVNCNIGDLVKFKNINCVILNKIKNKDLITDSYLLEEILL